MLSRFRGITSSVPSARGAVANFSTMGLRAAADNSNKKRDQQTATHEHLMSLLDGFSNQDTSRKPSRKQSVPTFSNIPSENIDIHKDFEELVGHQQQEDGLKKNFLNQRIPRTGVLASRSVPVNGQNGGLQAALRVLRIKNSANKIPRTLNLQRYHEKPGKKKLRLRMEKQQRDFNMGIRRLFKLVNEARRKGY